VEAGVMNGNLLLGKHQKESKTTNSSPSLHCMPSILQSHARNDLK